MTGVEVTIIIIEEITKTLVMPILTGQMLHGWTKILVREVAIEEEVKDKTIMVHKEEGVIIKIGEDEAKEEEDILRLVFEEIDE